jgi:hypothetical protein
MNAATQNPLPNVRLKINPEFADKFRYKCRFREQFDGGSASRLVAPPDLLELAGENVFH